jgi:hypothetical protein
MYMMNSVSMGFIFSVGMIHMSLHASQRRWDSDRVGLHPKSLYVLSIAYKTCAIDQISRKSSRKY